MNSYRMSVPGVRDTYRKRYAQNARRYWITKETAFKGLATPVNARLSSVVAVFDW
jgi:hypothetical protein